MKVLHTADIHLKTFGDERWNALETLTETGKKEKIQILVISGDLFDAKIDAENLRPKIREIFSNNGFNIVLIPGNHDHDVYKGMYFGEDATLLTDADEPFKQGNVRIWGIPFEQCESEKVLETLQHLKAKLKENHTNIILYHGELLDAFFSRKDFGEEGEQRYMPVRLSYFKDINVQYVLAGHFHSSFDVRALEGGGYFVYPGSPISITKRETGQRKVNIFEVGKKPRPYALGTPHFEDVAIELNPFADEHPVEMVRACLRKTHPAARIILTVKGFVDSERIGAKEQELVGAMKQVVKGKCVEEHFEFRDIHSILADDLFKSFKIKLDRRDLDSEKKKQLINIAIRAMMEAKA
jgi:DNA repair exonuclease SbcCD nuclease subunit